MRPDCPSIQNQPPVYEVFNYYGGAPVLIGCDHAENRIPERFADLGLDKHQLNRHIAYDIGAKPVAILLAEMLDAPLIMSNFSRLIVDPNRHLDDNSLIVEHSDDVWIPGNLGLTESQRNERINGFFHPYHNAYRQLVLKLIQQHNNPIILSIHSFVPLFQGESRPWHYGVLWEEFHRDLATRVLEKFSVFEDLIIGDNQPYRSGFPQGYAQAVHAENNGIQMALIEIRQDLINNTAGQKKAADIIYQVISPIIQ